MPGRFSGRFCSSLFDVSLDASSNLQSDVLNTPFNTIEFLKLLEDSQSVGKETGWLPHYFVIFANEHGDNETDNEASNATKKPCALLPIYQKEHSYGEYVFDHSWANAFYQHGLDYYPKLLCALPFTPVSAGKLLIDTQHAVAAEDIWLFALDAIWRELSNYSSMHFLFMSDTQAEFLENKGYHIRRSIQFVFYNNAFVSFDDFLSTLKSRKRKSITKERKQIADAGVIVERLVGSDITEEVMQEFYYCYQRTYMKRSGHSGYLTRQFFDMLKDAMNGSVMIVKASNAGRLIASALFFYDDSGLYGRYWGALEEVSGLHFECCYYQGIEFAIENNLPIFNPGTQGEHKILRGFTPTYCYSAHKLHRQDFDAAVADFTKKEAPHIDNYMRETTALLPFKQA
ncbi:MAG: GNAT family N-acetyltransferase [Pseudomonadota bacterium]